MVSVSLSHSHDAAVGRLHCSEEIRAESISVGSQDMHQGATCGNRALKRVSSCVSDKSWWCERMSAIVLALPAM